MTELVTENVMINIAEVKDIKIDLPLFREEWEKQVEYAGKDFDWQPRTYVPLDWFTPFFQDYLLHVEEVLQEKPKNYLLQIHDPELCNDKWYLNIAHVDELRHTCLTTPIHYSKMEPVCFYTEEAVGIAENEDESAGSFIRGKPIKAQPDQVAQYSDNHPTLLNVKHYHNVRLLDLEYKRIFIQCSFDTTFDQFLQKDINISIY